MPSSGSREGVHWAAMKTIEELEELNHQLQVELRKARAAQAQAEAANQNKSVFLANMSHEIQTPLNVIMGSSNLIVTAATEEEKRMYAEVLENNCSLLLQLINDILDLSKNRVGNIDFCRGRNGAEYIIGRIGKRNAYTYCCRGGCFELCNTFCSLFCRGGKKTAFSSTY